MKIRNLTSDGDWTFGRGKSCYVSENEGVAVNIKTKLNEWLGDCFFAPLNGIDWSTRLGYHNQKELLDQDIKNVIIGIEEVVFLTQFESTVADRVYTLNFSVATIYSDEELLVNYNYNNGVA